jgi:alkanesulfonate monooxygenase SsuD/methylene tetrahydromethanopterin reductase-like flavin-dependent oxidoreductase (luciferase family)
VRVGHEHDLDHVARSEAQQALARHALVRVAFGHDLELGGQLLLETLAKNYGRTVTVGEAGRIYGCGISPHVVGTAEQVADQLEAMFDEVGGDGFLLMTHYLPGSLSEFTEMVVPILQARGRFRTDYSGRTLRDHLREQ